MAWNRKVAGGVLGVIGFMLSPLSWWNDLFVNVPLAVGFGWGVALVYPAGFKVAVVIGYWMTNVLGFWLLHKGAQQAFAKDHVPYPRRSAWTDLAIASSYTLVIVVLLKLEIIQPFSFPETP